MSIPYEPKEKVIQAVLRVLQAEREQPDNGWADAEAEYADDLLALAARELSEAVEKSDPKDHPVGWAMR